MKVLAWNVRGLGSPAKRALIKSIISNYDSHIVIITETKLQFVQNYIIKSIWGEKVSNGLQKALHGNQGAFFMEIKGHSSIMG